MKIEMSMSIIFGSILPLSFLNFFRWFVTISVKFIMMRPSFVTVRELALIFVKEHALTWRLKSGDGLVTRTLVEVLVDNVGVIKLRLLDDHIGIEPLLHFRCHLVALKL
jgi:hypothetical protein